MVIGEVTDSDPAGLARSDDLSRDAALLAAELKSERYHDARYLAWLYDANPAGHAIRGSVDDEHGRIAHCALVPQEWRGPDRTLRLAVTLNAAVATRAQRGGRFTALTRELFARAAREGIAGTLTVANRNSTPAFLRKLGLRMVRPLPVAAVCLLPGAAGARSLAADAAFRDGPGLAVLAEELAAVPVDRWVQRWTAAQLGWRLARPDARYAVHLADDVGAISTMERVFGMRAAVLLKLWPRRVRTGVSARAVVAAACRYHRALFAIHAGINAHVRVPGVPVPRRLLPSPLNLLSGSFDDRLDPYELVPDTYEFLDADHY